MQALWRLPGVRGAPGAPYPVPYPVPQPYPYPVYPRPWQWGVGTNPHWVSQPYTITGSGAMSGQIAQAINASSSAAYH